MSDLPKNVARPHRAAHRAAGPHRVIIPDKDGNLQIKEVESKPFALVDPPKKAARPPRDLADRRKVVRKMPSFEEHALKLVDIVAFNTRAEEFFVYWLAEKIRGSEGKGVELGWVFPNAAFELDISIETAKRYLAKHTADRAEFFVQNKRVHLKD